MPFFAITLYSGISKLPGIGIIIRKVNIILILHNKNHVIRIMYHNKNHVIYADNWLLWWVQESIVLNQVFIRQEGNSISGNTKY
jgi:hypothetical protein